MNSETKTLTQQDALALPRPKQSFRYYRNLTFGSLLVGYASYYLCRQNLSAAYGPMKESLGITLIQFGWINSAGTFVYALGKVITGSFADSKYGGKTVFYFGLFGSALFSFVFSVGTGLTFFILVWSVNRFFQSMGWGGLVNVMAHWFPKDHYGTAMGLMSISYQLGGLLAALYTGFLLSHGGGWKALFVIPAITLSVIGMITYPLLFNSPKNAGFESDPLQSQTWTKQPVLTPESRPESDEKEMSYLQRFLFLLADRNFIGMAFLSFILTFLRECFGIWMPAYFTEMGASASVAAFKSMVFPLLGCIGTLFAGWFSDRYLSGRRAPVMAGLMLLLVACLFCLGNIDFLSSQLHTHFGLAVSKSTLGMLLVGATGFFLLGPYSLIGGVVALDFGGRKTSGTAAGLLDGAGYLGATLSGIGIASLVVNSGWSHTFLIMSFVAILGVAICFFLWQVKPRA